MQTRKRQCRKCKICKDSSKVSMTACSILFGGDRLSLKWKCYILLPQHNQYLRHDLKVESRVAYWVGQITLAHTLFLPGIKSWNLLVFRNNTVVNCKWSTISLLWLDCKRGRKEFARRTTEYWGIFRTFVYEAHLQNVARQRRRHNKSSPFTNKETLFWQCSTISMRNLYFHTLFYLIF